MWYLWKYFTKLLILQEIQKQNFIEIVQRTGHYQVQTPTQHSATLTTFFGWLHCIVSIVSLLRTSIDILIFTIMLFAHHKVISSSQQQRRISYTTNVSVSAVFQLFLMIVSYLMTVNLWRFDWLKFCLIKQIKNSSQSSSILRLLKNQKKVSFYCVLMKTCCFK